MGGGGGRERQCRRHAADASRRDPLTPTLTPQHTHTCTPAAATAPSLPYHLPRSLSLSSRDFSTLAFSILRHIR